MHIDIKLIAPALLAAVSCSSVSMLGISADVDDERAASNGLTTGVAAVEPLRSATVISSAPDEWLQLSRPTLGDVDGDGLDDFIVEGPWEDSARGSYGTHSYVFYGKRDRPPQLGTGNADAWFDSGAAPSVGLGDIDGDGLADIALSYEDGTELVLGNATRLAGGHARYATGLQWSQAQGGPVYLRKAGDFDGDGLDEFIVTTMSDVPAEDIDNRTAPLITNYIVAGQRDVPSGQWDPSWAVAYLGDDLPSLENRGLTTAVQRMVVSGCADLDGDGYDDILAMGRWRMWVFYGSANGFHGELTTAQADAAVTWPYTQDETDVRRAQFAKTVPFIVGDVDGDGAADIGLPQGAELGIVYGAKKRWSGRVQLEPDLKLALQDDSLPERNMWTATRQDIAWGAPYPELVAAQIRVGVADLDGDGKAEIVLQKTHYPSPADTEKVEIFTAYAVSAASQHATGRYVLSDADIYRPSGVSGVEALSQGTLLDEGGDFDGDGSADLIFGVQKFASMPDGETSIHVLPGAPHAPE